MMNLLKIELDNKKIMLIILAGIAIIYFDFSLVLNPQLKSSNDLTKKISKLDSDMKKLSADSENMKKAKAKGGPKIEQLHLKKILSTGQITGLLEVVSDIAQKNSVVITHIKPGAEVQSRVAKGAVAPKFANIPITIEMYSDYHKLGRFLNELEDQDILLAVESMKISPQQNDLFKQKVTLTLKTYVKK